MDDALAVAREEGREERDKEIAKKLKVMGDSPEKIHAITGLTLDEIENL